MNEPPSLSDISFSHNPQISIENEEVVRSNVADLEKLFPKDILAWIKGEGGQPDEIRKLGEDITSKLNWYIVYVILGMYSRIPTMFTFMQKAEAQIYDSESEFASGKSINVKELTVKYLNCASELNNVLEFARKFTLQNKDILAGSDLSDTDKILVDKIRQLKPEQVRMVLDKVTEVLAETKDD